MQKGLQQLGFQGPKDIQNIKFGGGKGKQGQYIANPYVINPSSKYKKRDYKYKKEEIVNKGLPINNPLDQIRKNAIALIHKRDTPQLSIHSFGSLLRPLLNIYRNKLVLSEREVIQQISLLFNSMRDDELKKLLPRAPTTSFNELHTEYSDARTIKQISNAYSFVVDAPLSQLTETVPNLDESVLNKVKERIIRITHKGGSMSNNNSYSLLNVLIVGILRICEFYSKYSTFPSQLLPITTILSTYHEDASEGKLDPEVESKAKVEIVNVLLNNGQILYPLIEPLIYGVYRIRDIDYLVTKYLRGKPNKNKSYVRGRGRGPTLGRRGLGYRRPRYYPYSYYQPRYKRLGRRRINPDKYTATFFDDDDFY